MILKVLRIWQLTFRGNIFSSNFLNVIKIIKKLKVLKQSIKNFKFYECKLFNDINVRIKTIMRMLLLTYALNYPQRVFDLMNLV